MSLLRVDNLAAGYGKLVVLHGISLDVGPREIVALMGSNGAGKTTTLKSIVGLLKPSSGTIELDGSPVTGSSPESLVPKGLVLVPEGRGMLRELTVRQNLELGAWTLRNARDRVDAALARAFETFPILADRQQQLAGTMSGGEQQMLALARALMSEPKLVLIDEASMGLSPSMTEVAFELIAKMNTEHGVAVLLVEQNVLALDLAHRVFVLEKGEIVSSAEGAEVANMAERLREAYLGNGARDA